MQLPPEFFFFLKRRRAVKAAARSAAKFGIAYSYRAICIHKYWKCWVRVTQIRSPGHKKRHNVRSKSKANLSRYFCLPPCLVEGARMDELPSDVISTPSVATTGILTLEWMNPFSPYLGRQSPRSVAITQSETPIDPDEASWSQAVPANHTS